MNQHTTRISSGGQEGSEGSLVKGIHYETGKPVEIRIVDGMISEIRDLVDAGAETLRIFLAPGLIDNQVNGYGGIDFSGDDLTAEGIGKAAHSLREKGVSTFFPTLITNSHENLVRNFGILAESLADEDISDSIPGFHLEGPYISPEEGFRGAHPAWHIRKPSWREMTEYQEAAEGKIRQVTFAPELEGAKTFIRECSEAGIEVAMGHTNASAEQIRRAVDYGVRLSVHLGNGCADCMNRHKNPLWPQLADDRIIPSIISDGHHLTPEEINVFYRVKGNDRMILTSDITSLAGMPPGIYPYAGSRVRVTEEGTLINLDQQCLSGASVPLIDDVAHFISVTGCSLSDALNLASRNVAKIYGLGDRGELLPGKRADLILFEKEGERLVLRETWVGGKPVKG